MTGDDDSGTETPETLPDPVRTTWAEYRHPSTAIVEAVAAATNRDSTTMKSLYDEVNTDALDALVTTAANGTGDRLSVSFRYDGADVTVYSDGDLEVRPAQSGEA